MGKKFLVVSSTGMGDSLWGTPALRALRKSFPDAQIDLVLDHRWEPLFKDNPNIDRIFRYKKQWYNQIGLMIRLGLASHDTTIIFHANRDIRRVLAFHSAPQWTTQPHAWISDDTRIRFDTPTHGIQKRLTMIERLGANLDGGALEIFFTKEENRQGKRWLDEHALSPGQFIYLNVGVSTPKRQWPPERFIQLAQKILNETEYKIVLGGGPRERTLIDRMMDTLGSGKVTRSCDLDLKQDCYVIGQARAMVSCNTGPMHLAFAMRTPTVALFIDLGPEETGPFQLSEAQCIAIHAGKEAEGQKPGENIPVDQIWQNLQRILELNPAGES